MAAHSDVPVLLVAFARPHTLRLVFERIRQYRPTVLLIALDAPRTGNHNDQSACREVRSVLNVDWPCEVLWNVAERNLGCDERMNSALDWAFEHVDRAIVLEDDIVAEPDFFTFAADMLTRFHDDHRVMHVTGRNEMGRWKCTEGFDHLRIVRGSVWGWATWARAWNSRNRMLSAIRDSTAEKRLARLCGDPVVSQHLDIHLAAARQGHLSAWDVTWSLARALGNGLCVAPPANLISNIGFGPDATRTTFRSDVRGRLRSYALTEHAHVQANGVTAPVATQLDRWTLLFDLMSTYRDPMRVLRLAQSPAVLNNPGVGHAAVQHHLTPLAFPGESLRILDHVEPHLDGLNELDPLRMTLIRASKRTGTS